MSTKKKIENFKSKVNKMADKLEIEIYSICEDLDYKNSSLFSYNIDKLKEFRDFVNSCNCQINQ